LTQFVLFFILFLMAI